jgi:hypothetical protein
LPDVPRQVKAFFVAVPQIEHNWTANGAGIPKTQIKSARPKFARLWQ